MTPTRYKGFWWLPDDPDTQLAGWLSLDARDKIHLEAIGLFRDPLETLMQPEFYPTVFGFTTSGEKITLYRCVQTSFSLGGGVSTSDLHAHAAFVGAHLDSPDEAKFSVVFLDLPSLAKWTNLQGLSLSVQTEGNEVSGVRHEFRIVEKWHAPISNWEIAFVASARTNWDPMVRASIKQDVLARITFREPQTFTELSRGSIAQLQDFLSLATGSPEHILDLRVRWLMESNKDSRLLKVHVRQPDEAMVRRADPEKMLFTFEDIASVWPDPLQRLVSKPKELGVPVRIYCSALEDTGSDVELEFLRFLKALEAYHRGAHHSTLIDDKTFRSLKERISRVLAASELDSDALEALTGKLAYWNEASLRTRLRAIIKDLEPGASDVLSQPRAFVNSVVSARNYLTHYDGSAPSAIRDVPRLIQQTRGLRFLLEQSLLTGLNVPRHVIERHLQRTRRETAALRIF